MIYLDHHATTPLCPAARAEMLAAMEACGANPSSVHAAGRRARAVLERARASVADCVGAAPREMMFTSGGTEAVHLGVRGVGEALGAASVWVDPGAHPSVRRAAEALARARGVEARVLTPGKGGAVDVASLARSLADAARPALVAVSVLQHETGALADVPGVHAAVHACRGVLVLDAVQALGKVPLDLPATGAAAAALSAHKIGGPCGVGALWLRGDARAGALLTGGGQERGLRAGTENVLGAAGFGGAARALGERLSAQGRVGALRERVEAALRALPGVVINGAEGARAAGACHASLRGVAGEELVAALDLEGFCVSSGPACSSGRPGPSGSMLAMFPDEPWRASSALRITLGPGNTAEEVARLVAVLPEVVARVRAA